MLFEAAVLQMLRFLNLTIGIAVVCILASCAQQPVVQPRSTAAVPQLNRSRISNVRTTAYTRTESGGRNNALGLRLSSRRVMSAASDWSRFPLGTHFRIVGTRDEYVIDDYGTALVGTDTIDLYKPTRLEMKRWGVRNVDIDIVKWGSDQESLKILGSRAKHRTVRQMIGAIQKKKAPETIAAIVPHTSL
jgi:3D (Asp-Asp-Asp) domain-containing protein